MRRTVIIIIGVILLIALGVGLFFFFTARGPQLTVGTPTNPFGDSGAYQGGEENTAPEVGSEITNAGEEIAPKFVRITDGPVVPGAAVFSVIETITTGVGTSTATTTRPDTEVRYLERESGNVYAYRVTERSLTRLTNQTIPGTQDVSFAPNGSYVYLRYISSETGTDRIETYALALAGGENFFLEQGLSQVLVTASSSLLTLLENGSGATVTTAALDGSASKTAFTSPLAAIRVFGMGTSYGVVTKSSASVGGYVFRVVGGTLERLLGPTYGLTSLPSPSGKYVLYSMKTSGGLRMELLNVATREVITLPVATLAEKCVFTANETSIYCGVPRSVSGTLPDDWYQGAVSFSDRLWRIDLAGRVAVLVVDPLVSAQTAIDAVSLTIDPKSDALVFTNKSDGSLYVYDL